MAIKQKDFTAQSGIYCSKTSQTGAPVASQIIMHYNLDKWLLSPGEPDEIGLQCIIMCVQHCDNALRHLCTRSLYLDRQGGGVTDGFFNHQVKPIAETFLTSSDGQDWPKSNPLTNLGVIRMVKSLKDR